MGTRGDDIWIKGDNRLRSEGTKSTGIGYNPDDGPICCVRLIRQVELQMRIYQDPKTRVYRVPSSPVPCNGPLTCTGCFTLGAHIPPQGSQGFHRRAKQRRDQRVMAVHNASEQTVKDPQSKRLQAYASSSSSSDEKQNRHSVIMQLKEQSCHSLLHSSSGESEEGFAWRNSKNTFLTLKQKQKKH